MPKIQLRPIRGGLEKFMFNPDFLLTISTTTPEIENANLFPFPFGLHLMFCAMALIFFAWRFSEQKKPFQIIFAIAIPLSLTIWLSKSKPWFYIIGLVELLLILAALVTCFIFRDKTPEEDDAETPDDEDGDAADGDSSPENEENSESEDGAENK
ncbi:MAG: hypothetical protein J6K77_00245 [Ruminococcus sp.]|nr:hypothetical protein [Ruminococcus sp.]